MVQTNNEYLLKIVVLGSNDAQKTEIIRKYAEDKFDGNYLPTLGVDITTKKITIMNDKIKLIIVDAAGQEFFGKLRPSYYRGASAALIFCNIYDRSSIESIPNWIKEFKKYIPTKGLPMSIAVVKNDKETNKKEKRTDVTPNYSISLKHSNRKNSFLQIMKKILFFSKKKATIRKTIYRKNIPSNTPKEWLNLSNSELVRLIALKYELRICNVDMKNSKDILKCFTHLAKQAINL